MTSFSIDSIFHTCPRARYKDSTLVMQLLRDALTDMTSDLPAEDGEVEQVCFVCCLSFLT